MRLTKFQNALGIAAASFCLQKIERKARPCQRHGNAQKKVRFKTNFLI